MKRVMVRMGMIFRDARGHEHPGGAILEASPAELRGQESRVVELAEDWPATPQGTRAVLEARLDRMHRGSVMKGV